MEGKPGELQMKDIMITVNSSIQQKGEVDTSMMELMTEAKMSFKDDVCHLIYQESEVSGLEGTKTALKIGLNAIELKRFGANTMELHFKRDQRTTSNYHTPYGDFELFVRTRSMDVELDLNGFGKVSLTYDMLIQGLSESRNTLEIVIRPV